LLSRRGFELVFELGGTVAAASCFATNAPTCILATACFLFLERRSLYALISQMRAPAHAAPPTDGAHHGGVTAANSKMYLHQEELSKTARSE
jgi:hypothetical protein